MIGLETTACGKCGGSGVDNEAKVLHPDCEPCRGKGFELLPQPPSEQQRQRKRRGAYLKEVAKCVEN